jgi:dodecin
MSVYKVVEIIGTSTSSWQDAAAAALATAQESLRDLRIAEVVKQDIEVSGDAPVYRVKLAVSFKYEA